MVRVSSTLVAVYLCISIFSCSLCLCKIQQLHGLKYHFEVFYNVLNNYAVKILAAVTKRAEKEPNTVTYLESVKGI